MREFILQNPWVIYAIIAWTLPWKGVALWKAARSSRKLWFVILFLLNTLAILDIIFIWFCDKKEKDNDDEEKIRKEPIIIGNGKRIVR